MYACCAELYLLTPGSFTCSHQAHLPARTKLIYFERVWNGWVVITYCSEFEYLLFLLTICRRTKWWRGWSTPCWSMATSTLATAVVWWSHLSLTDAIGLYRFISVKNAFASFFFQFFSGSCYAVVLFWWERHLYTILSFVIFVFYCRKRFFCWKCCLVHGYICSMLCFAFSFECGDI